MIKTSAGRTLAVVAAMTLALFACGDNALGPDPNDVEFAASLNIDLATMTETASGLFFRDDVVGQGDLAAPGDSATVDFDLWLAYGTSLGGGTFPFILGSGGAIAGFDEGVTGMRVGGERTLVIPASLGYGSDGFQSIPGDAVIVYALDLIAIRKPPF